MRDRWYLRILYREWFANRTAHAIVIGVIALTLLMYCIYGAWADEDLTIEHARSLDPGAPLLVYYPDWAMQLVRPEMSVREAAEIPGVSHTCEGVVTHLLTPAGTADAWGIDLEDTRLVTSFDVQEGLMPQAGRQEIAVSAQVAREGGVVPGDEMALYHIDADSGARRSADFRVSGILRVDDAWSQLVVGDGEELAELVGLARFNAVWAWEERVRHGHRLVDARAKDNVSAHLPRVRAPSYPGEVSSLGGELSGELQALGGAPSPFLYRVSPALLHSDTVLDQMGAMRSTGVASVSGLVSLMFVMVAAALTLTVLIIVLDRQRIIGTYAVLGMSSEDIGRMFRSQLIADSLLGTAAGLAAFALISAAFDLQMTISPLTLILWGIFLVVLVCWGGRVAWVLSDDRDLRAHLRGDTDFDWWKLIDIFPRPVGAERRSEG